MRSESDIAWAAGLFEGEGSIVPNRGSIRLTLRMTDRDVVERFFQVVGVGRCFEPKLTALPHWKKTWEWTTDRHDEVVQVMELLVPWGTHRYLELMSQRAAAAEQALAPRACNECGEMFSPTSIRHGLRQRFCSTYCRSKNARLRRTVKLYA